MTFLLFLLFNASILVKATNFDQVPYNTISNSTFPVCGTQSTFQGKSLMKRSNPWQTRTCLPQPRIARIAIAVDCHYIRHFRTVENAKAHISDVYKKVNQIYRRTFNLNIQIVEAYFMEQCGPQGIGGQKFQEYERVNWNHNECPTDMKSKTYNTFKSWAIRNKMAERGIAFTHLFTGCKSKVAAGYADIGVVCSVESVGVTNPDRLEAEVVAHEMGHALGANHDCGPQGTYQEQYCCPCEERACQDGKDFIMAPAGHDIGEFSLCTQKTICQTLKAKGKCLKRYKGGRIQPNFEQNQKVKLPGQEGNPNEIMVNEKKAAYKRMQSGETVGHDAEVDSILGDLGFKEHY